MTAQDLERLMPRALADPLYFGKLLWPQHEFYDKQREIIWSVERNDETYVTAANKMGKDFGAGFVCVSTFLRAIKRGLTCRIVTTSATAEHLNVLWSEIAGFVAGSKTPLLAKDGGILVLNHQRICHVKEKDVPPQHQKNYIVGIVAKSDTRGEGLSGHHADVTLGVVDEASGSSDIVYTMFQGWAKRLLIFGNPHECSNFFKRGVEAGDLLADQRPMAQPSEAA